MPLLPFGVTLDAEAAVILALVGVAVGLVGVLLGAVAWFQLHRMRRSYALLAPVEGKENYLDVLARTRESLVSSRSICTNWTRD